MALSSLWYKVYGNKKPLPKSSLLVLFGCCSISLWWAVEVDLDMVD